MSARRWPRNARWFLAEFMVVLTGVLVALALTAWWGERQNRQLERAYLFQLHEDLAASEADLSAIADSMMTRALHSAAVGHAFWAPSNVSDDLLVSLGTPLSSMRTRPVLGTAQALVATGDLRLIRSDRLRSELMSYLEWSQARVDNIARFDETYYRPGVALIAERFDPTALRRLADNATGRNVDEASFALAMSPSADGAAPFPVALGSILQDANVYRGYSQLLIGHRNQAFEYRRMAARSRSLRSLVHQELHGVPDPGNCQLEPGSDGFSGSCGSALPGRSPLLLELRQVEAVATGRWRSDGRATRSWAGRALMNGAAAEDWQIAERLGVAHLVKGSVRQFGERLRVTAQLARTTDGVQLWSEAYDRDAADLLDVQRDVAEKVASALDVLLDDERRTRMFAARTRSVEAFEAYLRGREILFAAHRDDDRTLAEANLWLGQALELDPRFARAALLFADRYAHRVIDGPDHEGAAAADISDEEALERLRSALDQTARNAPDAYHRIIAEINREFFAPSWRRLPSLFEQLRGAVAVGHPSSDDLWAPQALLIAGEFDLARQWAERALLAEPLEGVSHWMVALVETAAGDHARARSLVTEGVGLIGEDPLLIWLDFTLSTMAGDRTGALQRVISTSDTWRALGLAIRGERDAALASLEAQERNAWPQWKLLRIYHDLGDEERTRDLARRVDALPTGPAILAIQVLEAGRTLSFDLADTPNFAARLREVGVDPSPLPVLPRLSAAVGATR